MKWKITGSSVLLIDIIIFRGTLGVSVYSAGTNALIQETLTTGCLPKIIEFLSSSNKDFQVRQISWKVFEGLLQDCSCVLFCFCCLV